MFGRTRLARTINNKKYYALKIMKKSRIVKSKQLTHLQNEIFILSRLRCPFVIELHAVFQDENTVYLLLDYIEGGELFSHLRRDKKFPLPIYQFYAMELCCLLYHCHSVNIIIRDLKPENIGITRQGHLRLLDCSLAKQIENRTYTICGTPEYISPEMIQGYGYGISIDYWALGIIVHEMALGYPPFYGRNPFVIYRKILQASLPMIPTSTTSKEDMISPPSKAFIRGLLTIDRTIRLGCTSFHTQITTHSFFLGVDWNSAFRELIVSPMIPTVSTAGDSSNYDYYPEEVMEEAVSLTLEERGLFGSIEEILLRPKVI